MEFFKNLSKLENMKPIRLVLGLITVISVLVTITSILISSFDKVYQRISELEKEQYRLKFNQLIMEQETAKKKEFYDLKKEFDELSNLVMNNFRDIIEIRKKLHEKGK